MKKKKLKNPARSIGVQFGKRVVFFTGTTVALSLFLDALGNGLSPHKIEPYKENI